MVDTFQKPKCLEKYVKMSADELKELIAKYPYYTLPKIALLIQNHQNTDPKLLHHVALNSYDRTRLQQLMSNAAFFLT